MSMPTVAVVGRPNVGKSILFNRLLGGRRAIVSDQAGTTRNRHFGTADWGGRRFWLVDTGGLVPDSRDSMDRAIRRQVDLAVEQSDLVVMLVDGKEGLTPVDAEIAAHLRRAKRPVILAVNKLDDLPDTTGHLAFYRLGLGPGLPKGKRVKGFVQSCDVAPTVVDWLGIGVHPSMQGKTLLPLARGEVDTVRDFAIAGYFRYSWSIITEDWSFIHWLKDEEKSIADSRFGIYGEICPNRQPICSK